MSKFSLSIAVICIMLIVSLGSASYALYERITQQNTRRAQQAQFNQDSRQLWHIVLCEVEKATLADPRATIDEKRRSIVFFDKLLIKIDAKPCKIPIPPQRSK